MRKNRNRSSRRNRQIIRIHLAAGTVFVRRGHCEVVEDVDGGVRQVVVVRASAVVPPRHSPAVTVRPIRDCGSGENRQQTDPG